MFSTNIDKRIFANRCVSNFNVYKLIEENDCISKIEPVCDINSKAILEIYFCKENKKLMKELITNGLILKDDTKIDIKINLEEIHHLRRENESYSHDEDWLKEQFGNLNVDNEMKIGRAHV